MLHKSFNSVTALIILALFFIPVIALSQPHYKDDDIYQEDANWTDTEYPYIIRANNPANVNDNAITVYNGKTLTISPGVTVQFQSGKSLIIGHTGANNDGCIIAEGEITDSITFCHTAGWASTTPGVWDSVGITSYTSGQCEFKYCRFGGAKTCLAVNSNSVKIKHCYFTKYQGPESGRQYAGNGIKWNAVGGNNMGILRNHFDGAYTGSSGYYYCDLYIPVRVNDDFKIANNIFNRQYEEDGTDYGIYMENDGETVTNKIHNNVFYYKDNGIILEGFLPAAIENNIFYYNTNDIAGTESYEADATYNNFYPNCTTTNTTLINPNYNIQPNFVSAGDDYHLNSFSGCRGQGHPDNILFDNLPHYANIGGDLNNDLGAYGGPNADSIAIGGYINGTLEYRSESDHEYYIVNHLHLGYNGQAAQQEALTIEPGVSVYFYDDCNGITPLLKFEVYQPLTAEGTLESPITITSTSTSQLPDRHWDQIYLYNHADGSSFKYCDISHFNYAVICNLKVSHYCKVKLSHSPVRKIA